MRFKGRVKKKPSSAGVESDKAIRQEALLPRLCPAPPPGLASSLNLSLHCTFCPADSLTVRSSQSGTPQPPPAPLHCEPEREREGEADVEGEAPANDFNSQNKPHSACFTETSGK